MEATKLVIHRYMSGPLGVINRLAPWWQRMSLI